MEMVTLDDNTRQPKTLVRNYESLIWTERFNTCGDFQLTTTDVENTLNLLPEGKFVSLMDTNTAMIVETHNIKRPKGEPAKLIVTGRSVESVLDRRVAIQSVSSLTSSNQYEVLARTPAEAAAFMMYWICSLGQIHQSDTISTNLLRIWTSVVTPPNYLQKTFTIPRGNLLTRVQELIQTESPDTRPADPLGYPVEQHGLLAFRPAPGDTAIGLYIYPSTNRATTVRFDASRALMDDGEYLFSKIGSANVAYGVGTDFAAVMYEGAVEPTGLNRRVRLIDSSESDISDVNVLRTYMSQELAQARETAIFDGAINQDIVQYRYGTDYYLGDIVTLVGDYGLVELARVTEYIRSHDATGEKGYPTLQTIAL